MLSRITTRILLAIASIDALLFGRLTLTARAQQPYSTTTSVESVSTARQLSQQATQKAEADDYRGAIADISKAIRLNPNEADFYYQRGLILGQLSDRQAAIRDFDSAILRNPNHARAYLHRGGMSFNLGSSYQITDYRGFNYKLNNIVGDRRGDARAILDLQTARDLFARQGDARGHQIADRLIKHFTDNSVAE